MAYGCGVGCVCYRRLASSGVVVCLVILIFRRDNTVLVKWRRIGSTNFDQIRLTPFFVWLCVTLSAQRIPTTSRTLVPPVLGIHPLLACRRLFRLTSCVFTPVSTRCLTLWWGFGRLTCPMLPTIHVFWWRCWRKWRPILRLARRLGLACLTGLPTCRLLIVYRLG